jgi:hypothetical protein
MKPRVLVGELSPWPKNVLVVHTLQWESDSPRTSAWLQGPDTFTTPKEHRGLSFNSTTWTFWFIAWRNFPDKFIASSSCGLIVHAVLYSFRKYWVQKNPQVLFRRRTVWVKVWLWEWDTSNLIQKSLFYKVKIEMYFIRVFVRKCSFSEIFCFWNWTFRNQCFFKLKMEMYFLKVFVRICSFCEVIFVFKSIPGKHVKLIDYCVSKVFSKANWRFWIDRIFIFGQWCQTKFSGEILHMALQHQQPRYDGAINCSWNKSKLRSKSKPWNREF